MSVIPNEFDPVSIKAHSTPEAQMYREEVTSSEPMKSVLEDNPEIYFVEPRRSSEWGTWEFKPGSYYGHHHGAKTPLLARSQPASA